MPQQLARLCVQDAAGAADVAGNQVAAVDAARKGKGEWKGGLKGTGSLHEGKGVLWWWRGAERRALLCGNEGLKKEGRKGMSGAPGAHLKQSAETSTLEMSSLWESSAVAVSHSMTRPERHAATATRPCTAKKRGERRGRVRERESRQVRIVCASAHLSAARLFPRRRPESRVPRAHLLVQLAAGDP